MARHFAITTSKDKIELNAHGEGQATFTVSNSSGATARGRARIVPGDPVQARWYTVDGDPERTLRADQTTQYTVRIAAPRDTPRGEYTLRLDMIALDKTDEVAVEGPRVVVPCRGPAAPPEPGGFPRWLIPVIAALVLLVGGGVLAWVLLKDSTIDVPDIVAMNVVYEDAEARLKEKGFSAKRGATVLKKQTAKDTVIGQNPASGRAAKGSVITLDVAADAVEVPAVAMQSFTGETVNLFARAGLIPTIVSEASSLPENTIARTDPPGGEWRARGDTVTLVVTRQPFKPPEIHVYDLKQFVNADVLRAGAVRLRPGR